MAEWVDKWKERSIRMKRGLLGEGKAMFSRKKEKQMTGC